MRSTRATFCGRLRGLVLGSAASLALAAATLAGTALAADQPSQTTAAQAEDQIGTHTHQLHGLVDSSFTASAGATTFVLDTERYGKVTVSFPASSPRRRGHGRGQARSFEVAKVSDLQAGDRVVVQGHTSADGGAFVARRLHVLPQKSTANRAAHLVGTISNVSTSNGATTLTLKLADATTQSVTVSSDTRIRPVGKTVADLTVGTKVTVVARNGAASGIVVMPA
jgi:hypothetical protein